MQVTHKEDHSTHLVMSPQSAIQVSMVDSPELMHLLSSALYKNPQYALVRETLCNADDAHKEAGVEQPIEVTITEDSLIIRDFGKGIPKEEIGKIYGTYGLSTKKGLSGSTGGFGLGSKSPWSYADMFGVTSFHNGVKTIYRMIKVDPTNEGKPGIIPVADLPTEETGLIVAVPIKAADQLAFTKYVRQVVLHGDMNVILNGTKVARYPYSEAKLGFALTTDRELSASRIFIRYGAVVYPCDAHQYYETEYRKVITKLEFLNGYYSYWGTSWKLVIQAKPDSLSIAPSRDNLTTETRTQQTVKALLADVHEKLGMIDFGYDSNNRIQTAVATARKEDIPVQKLSLDTIWDIWKKGIEVESFLHTLEDIRNQFCKPITIPNSRQIMWKAAAAEYFPYVLRNKKLYNSISKLVVEGDVTNWMAHYIKYPLQKAVGRINPGASYYVRSLDQRVIKYEDFIRVSINTVFPLLSGEVIITTKITKLEDRLYSLKRQFPGMQNVVVHRGSQEEAVEIENKLTSLGYTVTNLAIRVDYPEQEAAALLRKKRAKERAKERKAGYVPAVVPSPKADEYIPLSSLVHFSTLTSKYAKEIKERITDPIAYTKIRRNYYGTYLLEGIKGCSAGSFHDNVAQMFGHNIAYVSTKRQEKKLKEKGIPPLEQVLPSLLLEHFQKRAKDINALYRWDALWVSLREIGTRSLRSQVIALLSSDKVREYFKIKSKDDYDLKMFIEQYQKYSQTVENPELDKINRLILKAKQLEAFTGDRKIAIKLLESTLLPYIATSYLLNELPQNYSKLLKILI